VKGGSLIPSYLPEGAPQHLTRLRMLALVWVSESQEAEAEARKRRHQARQAVARYETARLEYLGQMTLFEYEDRATDAQGGNA